jgi:hypothetical protein
MALHIISTSLVELLQTTNIGYYGQTEANQLRDSKEHLIYSRRIGVHEIVLKQSLLTWGP